MISIWGRLMSSDVEFVNSGGDSVCSGLPLRAAAPVKIRKISRWNKALVPILFFVDWLLLVLL